MMSALRLLLTLTIVFASVFVLADGVFEIPTALLLAFAITAIVTLVLWRPNAGLKVLIGVSVGAAVLAWGVEKGFGPGAAFAAVTAMLAAIVFPVWLANRREANREHEAFEAGMAEAAARAEAEALAVPDSGLIDILRTSKDRDELDAARAELEARRTRNRAGGIPNDSDGLDFLIGYVTGFPVPSGAGLLGAMLHSSGPASAHGSSPVAGAASAERADELQPRDAVEDHGAVEDRSETHADDTPSIDSDSGGGGGGGGGSDE